MNLQANMSSSAFASAVFCGSGIAVLLRQRMLRQIEEKPVLKKVLPPVAKRVQCVQYFGTHPERPDEYRGEDIMDPPKTYLDDYQWLRDDKRTNVEVLNHIKAENAYCESEMNTLAPLTETLYNEMLHYLKESDEEVPYKSGDFEYFSKTVKGLAYTIHCRRACGASSSADEVVILDENYLVEALKTSYLDLGALEASPSHNLMAYAVDASGYETYNIYIQPIPGSHAVLSPTTTPPPSSDVHGIAGCIEVLTECGGDIVWGSDDTTLFYTKLDEEHRTHQVWLHLLGTPQHQDVLLFQDDDGLFNVSVDKTLSGECVIISSGSIETSEAHVIFLPPSTAYPSKKESQDAHVRAAHAKVLVQEREVGLRYDVDHQGDHLFIVTNEGGAKNGKLVCVALPPKAERQGLVKGEGVATGSLQKRHWEVVRAYDPEVEISGVLPFKRCIAVFGRAGGGQKIWIYCPVTGPKAGGGGGHVWREMAGGPHTWTEVAFDEECYSVDSSHNHVYDTDLLRVKYSSLLTPQQVLDIDMLSSDNTTGFSKVVLKQKEVPGYDRRNYVSCRIYAPSASTSTSSKSQDVVMIPITLVFLKSLVGVGGANLPRDVPVLMSGYGSYGCSNDPYFSFSQLPLLNRGVVYAIAHIRGGGEMGRASWYEEGGKYFTKMNTFNDFAACGKFLQDQGISSKEKMAIVGRSAGGLLVGATINMYPDLFQAAVADVPFVDVMNTMSDPSIPLTVGEWEEWGNPNEAKYHDYMSKYCPYTNIKRQAYPALLITAGLFDPRVAYWEPVKFVSKLREHKTDSNLLMLKTDMSSGHFSASDRYKDLRERAFEMTFVLNQIANVWF